MPGPADWGMYRRTRIEETAGTQESLPFAALMCLHRDQVESLVRRAARTRTEPVDDETTRQPAEGDRTPCVSHS